MGKQVRDGGTKRREELKEENAARNATDGCGSLSLVSLPGGCASAQVEIGQMEGCEFVCVERDTRAHTRVRTRMNTHTHTHIQISWKRRQWLVVLRCCARDTLLTHFKH